MHVNRAVCALREGASDGANVGKTVQEFALRDSETEQAACLKALHEAEVWAGKSHLEGKGEWVLAVCGGLPQEAPKVSTVSFTKPAVVWFENMHS